MSEFDVSLPTPPRVRRRDKENQQSSSPIKKGIEWAEKKDIHYFSPGSGLKDANIPFSSSILPRKSILKPPRPVLPIPNFKQRDITPLPQDGLSNANYLAWPVSNIIDGTSSLRELTEAYSVLTARIREAVPAEFFQTQDDKRYPLFQPLRQHAKELAACIVRDLGRVFEDPMSMHSTSPGSSKSNSIVHYDSGLPSPRESPKKGGMTEEQVKCARDLSTTSVSVSRFLALAFSTSNIYSAFSPKGLSDILDAVLAIPMADSLRSSSSRKICGLAMTVLASQRLPGAILEAAGDRIVYTIRRGILGELGREGKKGAASESLKAIHDLCVLHPLAFIPNFIDILPCVLDALLSPTLSIRVQAANALGGFARGFAESSLYSELSEDVSSVVADFFLRRDLPIEGPKTTIQRTLQTTLRILNPLHHAQGPYWGVCVLASLIILLGPAVFTNFNVVKDLHALLRIGFFADKKMVRAFTQMIWSPLVWVWRKYHAALEESSEDNKRTSDYFEKILVMPACEPIGVVLLGALMGRQDVECPAEDVAFTLLTLKQAAKHGGDSTERSLDVLDRLVNGTDARAAYDEQWEADFDSRLLCKEMFSTAPGILTAEMDQLLKPIERIMMKQPCLDDVRPFTPEEKCRTLIWTLARDIWYTVFEQVQMSDGESLPETLLDIWTGLLRSKVQAMRGPEKDRTSAAESCAETLIYILNDKKIDLRENLEFSREKLGPLSAPALFLKLKIVRVLWSIACGTLSNTLIRPAIKPMIRYLVSNFSRLVPSDDKNGTTLSQWAELVAQVATVGSDDTARVLWTTEWDWDDKTRAHVWRSFVRGWTEDQRGSWKGAAIILSLPFENDLHWNMSDADLSEWSSLLQYAVSKAKDAGIHRTKALDVVAGYIDHQHLPTLSSSMRVADFLLTSLNCTLEESKGLPISLLDFVHEVLQTSYPPEPRNKIVSLWTLRSLHNSVNNCPSELLVRMLEILHDGISLWLVDQCNAFSRVEYSTDVVTLYQTILVALQTLPPSGPILQELSGLLFSALERADNSEALASFQEFWQISCLTIPEPREGWAESLKSALCIANCNDNEAEEAVTEEHDELDVLPRSASRRDRAEEKAISVANSNIDPTLVLTPKRSTLPLPTRRRRSSGSANAVLRSPESPSRRKSRKSIAHVMEREDCYGVDVDKENVSPIANRLPIGLGKRRNLMDNYLNNTKKRRVSGEESPSKCSDEQCGSDDADIEAVEAAIQVSTVDSDDSVAQPPALILAPNISRLNIAELGSRNFPITIDPPSPPKRRRTSYPDAVPSRLRAAKSARYDYQSSESSSSSDISEDSSSPTGPATPVSHQQARKICRIAGYDDSDELPMDESLLAFSPTQDALSRSKHPKARTSKVMNMRPKAIPKHKLGVPFTMTIS
ncbi:hypothetical protein SCHPADRAFT_198509 [Schizopora paradoxa]|uniref:Telomere-associated protein Rif1 N-terminal domain-containing protein n=1 Tax=Schizopora paradoxa TaxID=27342 RepID=A0A0H2SI28_9AGAM|nr:hypothetical protein SCHPADRAFT_198509 [Schizopora paradoxa]